MERLLEQGGLERGCNCFGAATIADSDGVRVIGKFLDDGTADGIADFSDEHFGNGLVLAKDFEGHAGLHTIFASKAEDGNSQLGFEGNNARVLEVSSWGTFNRSRIAYLAEQIISSGESFIEAVSDSRICIRSTASKVNAGLSDFHQSLGEFITLLLDDAKIA